MIKTLTLDGLTPVTIKQSAYDMARFCWVNNRSDADVFASCVNADCTENADEVRRIPAGEFGMLDTESYETLYLNGSGAVEIVTSAYAVCPFGEGKKGGGTSLSGSASYTISNAVDYPLLGLNLYGKSVQDGTPTPDNPVDIASVGDSGSVAITVDNGDSVSVTAALTTALPLCGIPVNSGGNYTDSTGQQWICDELVYNSNGSGKIVKKIGKVVFDGSEEWSKSGITEIDRYILRNVSVKKGIRITAGLCNTYIVDISETHSIELGKILLYPTEYDQVSVNFAEYGTSTVETFKDYLKNNPIVLYTDLIEPQEIELTAAEVDALRTLQTFNGVTNISNSAGAEMSVKYCTNKALSEYVLPIFNGLQAQIDELKSAVLSLGGNV